MLKLCTFVFLALSATQASASGLVINNTPDHQPIYVAYDYHDGSCSLSSTDGSECYDYNNMWLGSGWQVVQPGQSLTISQSNVVIAVLRDGVDYLTKRAQEGHPMYAVTSGGFFVHPTKIFSTETSFNGTQFPCQTVRLASVEQATPQQIPDGTPACNAALTALGMQFFRGPHFTSDGVTVLNVNH